jgi:hypothetical protein
MAGERANSLFRAIVLPVSLAGLLVVLIAVIGNSGSHENGDQWSVLVQVGLSMVLP